MKYLLPLVVASGLVISGAAFADEATHQDRAAIHHTTHQALRHERKEHRALHHGNIHRAALEQRKIDAKKAELHDEHHALHHDRVEGHE